MLKCWKQTIVTFWDPRDNEIWWEVIRPENDLKDNEVNWVCNKPFMHQCKSVVLVSGVCSQQRHRRWHYDDVCSFCLFKSVSLKSQPLLINSCNWKWKTDLIEPNFMQNSFLKFIYNHQYMGPNQKVSLADVSILSVAKSVYYSVL